MTAALIGLIGIIVGALLAGLLNLVAERSKRHFSGRTAALLIRAELQAAARRIKSTLDTGVWWRGDLPSAAWKQYAHDLALAVPRSYAQGGRRAAAVPGQPGEETEQPTEKQLGPGGEAEVKPPDLIERLTAAYTTIIDRWNVDRVAVATGPINQQDRESLEQSYKGLQRVVDDLDIRAQARPPGRTVRNILRVAAFVAVVALVVAALVQRPDLTNGTVAASLESQLGRNSSVECKGDGDDDWRCAASILQNTSTFRSCPTTISGLPSHLRRRLGPAVAKKPTRDPTCEAKRAVLDVTADRGKLVGTYDSSRAEQALGLGVIFAPENRERFLKRIWEAITG